MMTYVFGVLAGLVLGALVALINYNIMKNAVKKNSDKAVLLCNFSGGYRVLGRGVSAEECTAFQL